MNTPRKLIVAAVLAAALTGACSAVTGGGKQTLTGTLALNDLESLRGSMASCYGTGGYDDITAGAQVTIKNGSGTVLAVTSLGTGQGFSYADEINKLDSSRGATTTTADHPSLNATLWACHFNWTASVPANEPFYTVTISHRGDLTFAKTDLAQQQWHVDSTLGGKA
jgi:hypothetical protein